MKLRLVKPKDYKALAKIHYLSREDLSVGFFASTSEIFLQQYYKIVLNNKDFIALCAENENKICGFVTGTLDVESHFIELRKNKLRLGLALSFSFFKKPTLAIDAFTRYKATYKNSKDQFISKKVPRGEFWVWDKRVTRSAWSVILYKAHLKLLASLKVDRLNIEVDSNNKRILGFHEKNGAKLLESFNLPDGRERLIMYYELKKL